MTRRPLESLALLALLAATTTAARADVIVEGTVSVQHEIVVELGRDFPDTHFVVFPTDGDPPWAQREEEERGVAVITSATPQVRLAKFAGEPRLWAIRGALPARPEQITRAWLTERGAVCSAHIFTQLHTIDEDEGVSRIRTVFRVVEVTATGVRLEGVTEERLAPDGTVKQRSVPRVLDRPPGAPSPPPAPPRPDRRGGALDLGLPAGLGLAVSTLDPGHTPALALTIAGVALAVLVVRRRHPAPAA